MKGTTYLLADTAYILSDIEMREGHVPVNARKRLGYWTSDEFRKFAIVADCVLQGLVPDREYDIWYLVARMTELVFSTGRDCWTDNDIELFTRLAKRYAIVVEETLGVNQCVVTSHNISHLPEDIRRFSAPDNFWCFVFERAVKRYVQQPSNNKNIEATFARAEERRELRKQHQSRQLDNPTAASEQHVEVSILCSCIW